MSSGGGCSSCGTLSFNTLLSYLPDELSEQVPHELAHMLEMNHSRRFRGSLNITFLTISALYL
ncbi:M48 family metallopeptidase [Methanothermobacter sp.]|uniref:M48 metallopeptidase family protein n=1 Tax=Methanothermobacter sp. TaxID=1884223 RepID=UPI003C765C7C